MLLRLYSQTGSLKATLSPNDTSTQDKELQGDNVLSLSFTLYEHVMIDVNDYVDFAGERYWSVEKYLPNEKSTVEWEYDVKLYGIESLLKRFLVLNTVDGGNEAVFTLTARPADHIRLIVQNINAGMGGSSSFKVGTVEGTDNVVIDYTGKYCDSALKELAESVGVEWWIEGETLNLCRCERGEAVPLSYGAGLTRLDRDMADNAKFYTRLFPIGSSRNIDPSSYGASRLQLPGGAKYVDVNVDRYGVIHHFEEAAFSGIYPRRVGVVSSVRSESVTDSAGNSFTIWYFKDESLPFDPNAYEIGGLVKHVSFAEGSELSGLGDVDGSFEVNYDSVAGEFELITIWPYDDGSQLPGGSLVPHVGDRYILWNIRMPAEYYGLAELEFQSAVEEYNSKHALDVSRYKAPTDHVWVEEQESALSPDGTEGPLLYIGRRVRLESAEYFPDTGYRLSRITRISRHVTLPSQMDLEISDVLSRGTLSKIDDSIMSVKNYAGVLFGSLNVPDIIRSGDATRPTDNNLYSALRSHKEFLSRLSPDRAHGLITFLAGLTSAELATFTRGLVSNGLISASQGATFGNFVAGLYGGTGAQVDSHGNAEVESIRVRSFMEVVELIINRLSAIEGDQLLTEADTVESVEALDLPQGTDTMDVEGTATAVTRYRLHLKDKWDGYLTAQYEHNVLKGMINTLPGTQSGYSAVSVNDTGQQTAGPNKYYTSWMRVVEGGVHASAGNNWIDVLLYPGELTPAGTNFPPCAMMKIARWGNFGDGSEHRRRQHCIMLSSSDGNITMLTGVTKPVVENFNYGMYLGITPDFMLNDSDLSARGVEAGDVVLMADKVVARQFINWNRPTKPRITVRDRGLFDRTRRYYFESPVPTFDAQGNAVTDGTGAPVYETDEMGYVVYETSDVWAHSCRWRSLTNQPRAGQQYADAPGFLSPYWALMEGNRNLSLEFDTGGVTGARVGSVNITVVPHVFFGYEDISECILAADWLWERETGDGAPTALDRAWNAVHAASGRTLTLTDADLPSSWATGEKVYFRCTVTLRDGTSVENWVEV